MGSGEAAPRSRPLTLALIRGVNQIHEMEGPYTGVGLDSQGQDVLDTGQVYHH